MEERVRKLPVVAIDGPAGAGKSSVTRLVADALGYTRVDTGALYRTVAWFCMKEGVSLEDELRVAAVATRLSGRGALEMKPGVAGSEIVAFGEDVSVAIRSQEVGLGASLVSQIPAVRTALLAMQRELGRDGGVVLEGRDIGSVVFPDAEAKFFLTASSRVRALRRRDELLAKGEAPSLEEVQGEVEERDRRDTMRAIAPLTQATDAIVVDSSSLGIEAVAALIVERVLAVAKDMQKGAL